MSLPYRSHADLGGQPGHGRVVPEPEGELWHGAWEPRALALTLATARTAALATIAGTPTSSRFHGEEFMCSAQRAGA